MEYDLILHLGSFMIHIEIKKLKETVDGLKGVGVGKGAGEEIVC